MTSDRIGNYSILDEIAAGAQGAVFRAHDATTGRIVALKVLHRELASDDTYVERFRREATLAASINHPNIVEIYEVGEDNRQHFIAVEYLPESLSRLIEAGPVPIELAALYSAQLADGLAAAHVAGVIHRDIKPQNVLIGADGSAKITDFGIARGEHMTTMTSTGVMMGTPYYMSPEQASGQRADGRSDVYSLGCVIHQMLTGQVPFQAATPLAVLRQHIDEPPPPVRDVRKDTPKALADVVTRCLEKDPEKRFQTAAEVAAAVRAAMPAISSGTIQTAAAKAAKLAAARSVSEPPGGSKTGGGGLPKWIWAIAALVIVGIGAAVFSSMTGPSGTDLSASPPESALDVGSGSGPALTNAGEVSAEEDIGGEPQGEPTPNAAATSQAERAMDRLMATETALLEATQMAEATTEPQPGDSQVDSPTPSADEPVVIEVQKPRRFETQMIDMVAGGVVGAPLDIAFEDGQIWVTMPEATREESEGIGAVARIDQNGDIVDIYEVDQPLFVVAARGNAWVTQYEANQVVHLGSDGETLGTYPTDDGPVGIAFDGNLIWVANAGAGTITLLNLTGEIADSFEVGGAPALLQFDGEKMWVANTGDQWVARMSRDGSIDARVDLDGDPAGMAWDGDHIWVAVNSSARLLKIDDTGWVVLDVPTRDQPVGLGFDGSSIWVAHENDDLLRFNMSGDPIGKVDMPGATLIAFDGDYIWATPHQEPGANFITKVGPVSLAPFYFEPVTTAVKLNQSSSAGDEDQPPPSAVTGPTPTEPEVFKIDTTKGLSGPTSVVSTGDHIWVANYGDDTVQKMDLNGNFIERYEGFAGPLDILFDGEHIWVLNEKTTDISKLSTEGEQVGRFGAHLAPKVMALAQNKIWVATSQIIGGSEEFGIFGISMDGATGDWISGTEKLTDPINALEHVYPPNARTSYLWLAGVNSGVLERIEISGSGMFASTLAPIEIEGRTDDLVYDGFDLFVTDYENSSVRRLTSSGITFAIYKAGDGARSIVFDGEDLWIANERSKTVMRMSYNGDIMSEFEMQFIPQNMYFDGKNIWVTHLDANAVTRIGPVRLAPKTGRISPEPRDSEGPAPRTTATPIAEIATSPCIFDGVDTTVVSDTQWAGKLLSGSSAGVMISAIEAFFIVEPNFDTAQCEVNGLFTIFPPMTGSGPLNGTLTGGDGTPVKIDFIIPEAGNDASTDLEFTGSFDTSTGVIDGDYNKGDDEGSWTMSPIDLEAAPVIPNTPVPTQTPAPIATATPAPASVKVTGGEDLASTVGRRVFLTDAKASSSVSGDFVEIEVNWGDGSSWEDVGSIVTSGKIFANHVYDQTGNFEVTVLARSESGTESTATVNVSIRLAPTPTATPTPQRERSFINVSAGDNDIRKVGEIVRLQGAWGQSSQEGELLAASVDWGDGTDTEPAVIVQSSGEIDAMHIYTFPGGFTVTVKVMNDFGDQGMSQTSMRIEP